MSCWDCCNVSCATRCKKQFPRTPLPAALFLVSILIRNLHTLTHATLPPANCFPPRETHAYTSNDRRTITPLSLNNRTRLVSNLYILIPWGLCNTGFASILYYPSSHLCSRLQGVHHSIRRAAAYVETGNLVGHRGEVDGPTLCTLRTSVGVK